MLVNEQGEITTLSNLIRDGIEPRLTGIVMQTVNCPQGDVLVIRIPKSWSEPHMVTVDGANKFFGRVPTGKCPMSVDEIGRNTEFPESIQSCALFGEFCTALDNSLTLANSDQGPRAELGKQGAFPYLLATPGFRAGLASRAATAISRPEPMISDPPASMDRLGLSCQTR